MNSITASAHASIAGLPQFALYWVAALILTVAFVAIYVLITPQRDFQLLRQGNMAAAVCLGSAILGFAIPLSKSIAQSHDLVDMIVWAVVALVVQITVLILTSVVIRHEARKIEEGDMATAWFFAFAAVSAGFVTAACMTYTP